MSTVSRVIDTRLERVWAVLSDGWFFPMWVVGASRTRNVDDCWPEPGSRLHHSVGAWPALLNDHTEVLDIVDKHAMKLRANAGFLGAAEVTITLKMIGGATNVTIEEEVVSGPGRLIPDVLIAPMLRWRNVETLRRLAFIAEHRPDDEL